MPPRFYRGRLMPRSANPPRWVWLEPLGADEVMVTPRTRGQQHEPLKRPLQPQALEPESDDLDSLFFDEDELESSPEWGPGTVKTEESPESRPITRPTASPRGASQKTTRTAKLKRKPYPKDAVEMFCAWLYTHAANPLPSMDEKKRMAAKSGIHVDRVGKWFYNNYEKLRTPEHRHMLAKAARAQRAKEVEAAKAQGAKRRLVVDLVESDSDEYSEPEPEPEPAKKSAKKPEASAEKPERKDQKTRGLYHIGFAGHAILRRWLMDHRGYPYPTESQKNKLCLQTGLSASELGEILSAMRMLGIDQGMGHRTGSQRAGMSDSAKVVLREWLHDNIANPFPTTKQLAALAKRANLSEKQVNGWFIKFRYYVMRPNQDNPFYDTHCLCCDRRR